MKKYKYSRTYNDLKKLISILESSISNTYVENSELNKFILDNYSNNLKIILGFMFLGLELSEGVVEFRSNRYFLDAIHVNLLPNIVELESTINILLSKDKVISNENIFDVLRSYVDHIWNKFNEFELPLIYKDFNFPKIDSDDLQFLDENGYLIVKNALSLDLCDELLSRVNFLAKYEYSSRSGGYFYGSGKMQRVYHLLSKDELFRDVVLHPITMQIMNHMFYRETFHEKYFLTSFHGNFLNPGAEPQIWHVDANVPDPLPSWIIRANSNFIVQDYTEDNGATQMIPKSHFWNRKPNKSEAENISHNDIQSIVAPKGSLAFWHGNLWHRSGANTLKSPRVALLCTYAASHLREMCMEENPYLSMNLNTIAGLTCPLKKLLGWEHGSKNY